MPDCPPSPISPFTLRLDTFSSCRTGHRTSLRADRGTGGRRHADSRRRPPPSPLGRGRDLAPVVEQAAAAHGRIWGAFGGASRGRWGVEHLRCADPGDRGRSELKTQWQSRRLRAHLAVVPTCTGMPMQRNRRLSKPCS